MTVIDNRQVIHFSNEYNNLIITYSTIQIIFPYAFNCSLIRFSLVFNVSFARSILFKTAISAVRIQSFNISGILPFYGNYLEMTGIYLHGSNNTFNLFVKVVGT